VIVAGDSVAGVKLGSLLTDFKAAFPKADEILVDDMCHISSYQWVDIDLGATGVYAYVKNDKIYQLSVRTPRFVLSSGVKLQVSEKQVRRLYPTGRSYILRYSGSAVNGGRDLHYWVDKLSGIAFELYWDKRDKQWRVSSIDVFPVSTEYQPEGCVSPPREWIETNKAHGASGA